MLTAELLRRNNRLNQDPIAEETADGMGAFDSSFGGRNATLKLKRRISREPNTGKILILPDNNGTNNEHPPSGAFSPTHRQSNGGGGTSTQ